MFSIRYAVDEDVNAIVALVQSAYRGDDSRVGWTTEADLLDGQRTDEQEVVELIRKPQSLILLCEGNGELLASVHLHNRGDYAYLGMFAVRPTKQGQGVGKYLLEQAEKLAFVDWGCDMLQMTVISLRKDLIAWYQRRGYRPTQEQVAFPYGDERFGVPKRDDLVLQVLCKEAGDHQAVSGK
jgi:GNAT superfamily N-acetyltransferase